MQTAKTKTKLERKSLGNELAFDQSKNKNSHPLFKTPPNAGILSPAQLIQKKDRDKEKAEHGLHAQEHEQGQERTPVSQEKEKDQNKEAVENQNEQTTQEKKAEGGKTDVVQGGFWSKVKSIGSKIGSAVTSGAKKAWGGIKKAGAWLKDKADIIMWIKEAGSFAKELWDLIKAKKWTDAYKVSKEGKTPPGMLAKLGAIVGLVTGPITIGKAIINIVRSVNNKKLITEGKKAVTDQEKKAKENLTGIQNIRLTMAAASATDGVLTIISSIMTLAGAATAGIGAVVAIVIQAVQLIISGAKMIYNEYRKRSADYKAKVAAENNVTAEGMISLKDAGLYNVIGMKYDEGSGKVTEDKQSKSSGIKDKFADLKRDLKGGPKEQEEVDESKQKEKIIEHLNKERDEAAGA